MMRESYFWGQWNKRDYFIEHVFTLRDWYCFFIQNNDLFYSPVEFFGLVYGFDDSTETMEEFDELMSAYKSHDKKALVNIIGDTCMIHPSIDPFVIYSPTNEEDEDMMKMACEIDGYLGCLKIAENDIKNMKNLFGAKLLFPKDSWNYMLNNWLENNKFGITKSLVNEEETKEE